MQLFHAHTLIGLVVAVIIVLVLLAIGLHPVLALLAGGLGGPTLAHTVLKGTGDRLEHWMTTMK